MAQANAHLKTKSKSRAPAKSGPSEEPDAWLNVIDDLHQCISNAKAIIGVLGDGVEAGADHSEVEVAELLYVAYLQLKAAKAAVERLDAIYKGGM
jgi:hypothetical protein